MKVKTLLATIIDSRYMIDNEKDYKEYHVNYVRPKKNEYSCSYRLPTHILNAEVKYVHYNKAYECLNITVEV